MHLRTSHYFPEFSLSLLDASPPNSCLISLTNKLFYWQVMLLRDSVYIKPWPPSSMSDLLTSVPHIILHERLPSSSFNWKSATVYPGLESEITDLLFQDLVLHLQHPILVNEVSTLRGTSIALDQVGWSLGKWTLGHRRQTLWNYTPHSTAQHCLCTNWVPLSHIRRLIFSSLSVYWQKGFFSFENVILLPPVFTKAANPGISAGFVCLFVLVSFKCLHQKFLWKRNCVLSSSFGKMIFGGKLASRCSRNLPGNSALPGAQAKTPRWSVLKLWINPAPKIGNLHVQMLKALSPIRVLID